MVVRHSRGQYEVLFGEGLPQLAEDWPLVTDENVARHYPTLLEGRPVLVLPPGETTKNLAAVQQVISWAATLGVRRNQGLIALGGGVIGDLVGFVASIYLRGVPFVQIPTSLLAMVDSSVGGKVGVDTPEGKNLVGSFWPPAAVHIHVDFLRTLPQIELRNGMAEVAKMGAIADPDLLAGLQRDTITPEQIKRSVELKRQCVEADEFETNGIRATLNFGHTIGHAIEQVSQYQVPHGQAVAMGMVAEAQLGEAEGVSPKGTTEWLRTRLQELNLPTEIPAEFAAQPDKLIAAMRRDKKVVGGNLAFALLTGRGTCKLCPGFSEEAVRALFK